MGRNRKLKQLAQRSSLSESEENGCHEELPVDFMTSDDFQVVQNRRHPKRSPDSPEDFPSCPRSRHNSCRISFSSEKDDEDTRGCHSSFWNNKYQCNGKSDGEATTSDEEAKIAARVMAELEICSSEFDGGDNKTEVISTSSNEVVEKNETKECERQLICDKNISTDHGDSADHVKTVESPPVQNKTGCGDGGNTLSSGTFTSETEHKPVFNGVPDTNSSPTESSVVKAKNQKKKKKQKLKKIQCNVTPCEKDWSHQSGEIYSSDNTPSDCPVSQGSDCKEAGVPKKDSERKRPSKKQIAAIHEALMKAKEEEERLKVEEETEKKLADEAERKKQEIMRLEQEKKEKRKEKEKAKRDRLKAEGRLLSKSQKLARARMLATIEIFRQQGVDIPQIDKSNRDSKSSHSKTTHRKRFYSTPSETSGTCESQRHKSESLSSHESKESFSDIPSSFESKESLDFLSLGSLTTESDAGHFSGTEESDAIDDDFELSENSAGVELKNPAGKHSAMLVKNRKLICEKVVQNKKPEVKLRSPVICVLGHVDTGKTKLLDFIRKTHIQDSEAGGITQQIGATMIPQSALKEKCKMVKDFESFQINVPGLLVIDTPGHESFRILRSRGTSLCDIAILVVDIMHGLQPQTLESINLLKESKIPFVVALNKIDRIYGWNSSKDADIVQVIQSQSESTAWEFKKRCQDIVLQFANECLNAALFYENTDPRSFVSMVPTSAITGDGMGNILSLVTQLTQSLMYKHLIFSTELKATVLEVKVTPGLGTTIDVILVNGQLHEGDTIVLAGQDGPFVTQIRSLLMPQPLKELRVKNPYIDYKTVEGAQGVKISGKDLDKTLAGMPLLVAENPGKVESLKLEIGKLLNDSIHHMKTSERGVYVQASTLGSLEALLDYLTTSGIPYFGFKVGPVVKKDVMKASIMLEHDIQYATILAFDVKIEKDAQELADHVGVKILHADIIYHLFDMFVEHREGHLKKLEEKRHLAVFPCILTLLAKKMSPESDAPTFVLHVTVEAGTLKEGTPLCVPKRGNLDVGTVSSIQVDGHPVSSAKEGESAVLVIDGDAQKSLELEPDDNLASRISRQTIEVLKEYYRDELSPSDWHLMSELKKLFHT